MKSTYEQQATKLLSCNTEKEVFIRIDSYNSALLIIDKLLAKCDELRKSRDNWKKKYGITKK